MFFETSAKDGSNVKTLFNELAKKLIGADGEEEEEEARKQAEIQKKKTCYFVVFLRTFNTHGCWNGRLFDN